MTTAVAPTIAKRSHARSDYFQLKPAVTLEDTLLMMRQFKQPSVVRLSRGLRIALRPGVRLLVYRPKARPSPEEIVQVLKAARQVGIHVRAMDGKPDNFGRFMCVIWEL